MSANSKIEWTDHTFNPWIGCTKVSPACDHCYAERSTPARAMKVTWGAKAERVRTGQANWSMPKRWNAQHEAFQAQHGRRQRVFCASLADVFDNQVPSEWREDLFELIAATPNLDWLLLTKRIGNVGNMLPVPFDFERLYPHVWIGATVVNQVEADRDIPKLLSVSAAKRFLSMEPLLGPVDLSSIDLDGHSEIYPLVGTTNCEDEDGDPAPDLPALNWVIVGGESGPGARPMHPDWVRDLRDQCATAGVPFLFKQWGEWLPGTHFTDELARADSDPHKSKFECARWIDGDWQIGRPGSNELHFSEAPMYRAGKKSAGRQLDGREWNEVPQ